VRVIFRDVSSFHPNASRGSNPKLIGGSPIASPRARAPQPDFVDIQQKRKNFSNPKGRQMPDYYSTMDSIIAQMRESPITKGLKTAIAIERGLDEQRAVIFANPNLNATGVRNESISYLRKQVPDLIKAMKLVERSESRLAERVTNLKPPEIDATSVVAAAMAVASCAQVKQMAPKEKESFLKNNASLPYLQAVLAGPNELTGIDRSLRESVRMRAIDLAFPEKLADLQRDREALQVLKGAVRKLTDTAREFADLPTDADFQEFLNAAVPDQRRIAADIEHDTAPLAAA
jgi:hypothetical protein